MIELNPINVRQIIDYFIVVSAIYAVCYSLCIYMKFERLIKKLDEQWIQHRAPLINFKFSSLTMMIVFQVLTSAFAYVHVFEGGAHPFYLTVCQITCLKIIYNIKNELKLIIRGREEDKICGYEQVKEGV